MAEEVDGAIVEPIADGTEQEPTGEVQDGLGDGEETPEQDALEEELREAQSRNDRMKSAISKKDKEYELLTARFGVDNQANSDPSSNPVENSSTNANPEDGGEFITKADQAAFEKRLNANLQGFVGQVQGIDQERAASQHIQEFLQETSEFLTDDDYQSAVSQTKHLNPNTPALVRAGVAISVLKGLLADKILSGNAMKAETKVAKREASKKAVSQPSGVAANAQKPAMTEGDNLLADLAKARTTSSLYNN